MRSTSPLVAAAVAVALFPGCGATTTQLNWQPSAGQQIQDPAVALPEEPLAAMKDCLKSGDMNGCMAAIEALYTRAGATTSDTLWLSPQPVDKPLSSYMGWTNTIRMTRFLRSGEGTLYWRNWSKVLTAGAWDPTTVGDELKLRLMGNFALMGILAHEMGHYLANRYGMTPRNRHMAELHADKLAIGVMSELRCDPELAA